MIISIHVREILIMIIYQIILSVCTCVLLLHFTPTKVINNEQSLYSSWPHCVLFPKQNQFRFIQIYFFQNHFSVDNEQVRGVGIIRQDCYAQTSECYDCVSNNYFQIPFSRFCGHNSHSLKVLFFRGSVTHHKPAMFNNVFTKRCQQKPRSEIVSIHAKHLVTLFDILVYFYILTFLGFFCSNAF